MKFGFVKKILLVILVLAVVFCGLNFWGGRQIKNLFYKQTSGLQAFLWQKGGALSFGNQDQVSLNKQLIEQNQKLLSDLADLDSLKKENKTLREALDIGLAANYQVIMAEVTAKNNFNLSGLTYGDSLLVNKGSRDGIQKGFPVVLSNKILLGKITEVYPDFARISLITGKDSVIDVQIQDSPDFALVKGQGNQKIILDMFPKDKELKSGALVMTSALGSAYPSGLLIGTVGNVSGVSSEAFRKAEINPAYDLSVVNKVFVIKNIIVIND